MKQLIFSEVQKQWAEIGKHKTPDDFKLEVELYKKLLNIFQIGDFYYLIFNPPLNAIEFTSGNVRNVLGYDTEEFTSDLVLKNIHPDDLPYFVDFETAVVDFKKQLPPEKLMNYKTRYNYRLRKKNGDYLHILQQSVTIQHDKDGAVLRNFIVHTDISHLKQDNRMMLSFIGLEGEPSYIDVQPRARFSKSKEMLSKREKEILCLLSQHYTSEEIACQLYLSKQTVSTHRKNMLRKTGTHTVLELVQMALNHGWI